MSFQVGMYYISRNVEDNKDRFWTDLTTIKMFRGERTFSWMDHNLFMAEGFAEFFKSGYIGNLINSWIPAVDNGRVHEKLKKVPVADIGCGFGIITLMKGKNISKFYLYTI